MDRKEIDRMIEEMRKEYRADMWATIFMVCFIFLVACLVLLLGGCNNGNSDNGNPFSESQPAQETQTDEAPTDTTESIEAPEAPEIQPEAQPEPQPAPQRELTFGEQFLLLLNDFRAKPATCEGIERPPVGPALWDDALAMAAELHAIDMAETNYFSHTGSDGSQFWDRVRRSQFLGQPMTENIAAGNSDMERSFMQWVNSTQGHCSNLRKGNVVGVGYAFNFSADYVYRWVYLSGLK